MIDKIATQLNVESFNISLEEADKAESFDEAIDALNLARVRIERMENTIRQMKQEEHDLTQDIYNKFKDKGFVKTIKF